MNCDCLTFSCYCETSKKDHLCKTSHRHGHTVLTRTVADGCVERTHPQPPDPQSETGTLATHSGKKDIPETSPVKYWMSEKEKSCKALC